jgi:hypothetical protein
VPRLSKSRFTAGLQCHRALWWKVHEPEAPELAVDPATQAVFDQGTRVGEFAREYIPGGHLIDFPHWAIDERIEATRRAISDGARVLYEASFREDDVYVAVDILHRPSVGGGWTLTEVKSTTKVKDEHVPDVAVQTHVVRRAGLSVEYAEIMHLNRECRHPDLSNLFTRSDVTGPVNAYLPKVTREVPAQLVMLERSEAPVVEPGDHCTAPYPCPFMNRCWPEAPAHSIETLYKISPRERDALIEEGYETIFDLPGDLDLGPIPERQRRAVQSGELVVEDRLREALASIVAPVAHLDFETIAPAIPVWPGCRPYDPVPVQFSVHVERQDGEAMHAEWLADGSDDPRERIARALVDVLRGARSIIAYHAPFEVERLRELQQAVPELAAELGEVITRIVDLLPIVRANVYHPDFGGSFSLKKVAPALVPGLDYEGMTIGDGGAATQALENMLLHGSTLGDAERKGLRKALFQYCEQDTLATIGVLRRLREVAGSMSTGTKAPQTC